MNIRSSGVTSAPFPSSRLTSHVSRLTLHASRFTSHASRLTLHVSRLTSHASRLTSHVSRFTSHVSRSPLFWALLLILFVRALAVFSYPPNIGGDCIGYYKMLTLGKSNLVHPPGYPFLVGLPLRVFFRLTSTAWWIDLHPVRVQYIAIIWQHLLSIGVLVIGALTVRRIFGRGVATLAVLFYGLRPRTIGAISWFFPEWFQADLLVLMLCALWFAFQARTPTRKIALYALSFLLFAWCYLTKYNALFFLPVLMAVMLFDPFRPHLEPGRPRPASSSLSSDLGPDRLQAWRLRGLTLALGLALAVGNVAVFAHTWHRASTGTAALSKDHAWVLLTALGQWSPGGTLSLDAGPETKRLHYLNSVLPWHSGAGPFWHIETTAEGPALRAPWREKHLQVLTAAGPALDALLATVPPPRAPYDFFTAFFPTYLYLGADESDRLGTRVFLENVFAYPGRFSGYYFRQLGRTLWRWPSRPQFDAPPAAPGYTPTGHGFWRRQQDGPLSANTFWYTRPLVWRPGARLLHGLDRLYAVPTWLITSVIGLYLARCAFRGCRHGLIAPDAVALILAAFAGLYMAGMHAVFFRAKEAHLLTPLVLMLLAVVIGTGWRCGLRKPNGATER